MQGFEEFIKENPSGARCGSCGQRVSDERLFLAATPEDPATPLPVGPCCLGNGFAPWRPIDAFSCNDCWWTGTERPSGNKCPFCGALLCTCHGMSLCPGQLPLGTAQVFIVPAEPGHFQEHSHQGVTWRSTPGIRALGVPEEIIAALVVRFVNGDWGNTNLVDALSNGGGDHSRIGSYTLAGRDLWVYQEMRHRAPTVMLMEEF